MAMLVAAESRREEEKAKGVNIDDTADNPDIMLYEDNEDDDDDESEEEDDGNGQAPLGRGRGRGMMWQPNMAMLHGGRPPRGFPPFMMGADGYGYGDNFATPDLFGMPRVFPPYGPRFPGDFSAAGPLPGMGYPGRGPFPMNGGLGFMMGPGRAPFMNAMGVGRPNRPFGGPPFLPPPPPNNRVEKRDQRRLVGNRSDRYEHESDQGKDPEDTETAHQPGQKSDNVEKFSSRNSFQNDESESDNETAPRRSRYGDRKRKQRGSEGESGSD